jgi:LysM repeat protein
VSKAKGGIERMLTMEQIYIIKYLRNHKGKSLRKIAKETGHDFETVKKYVEKNDFNLYPRPCIAFTLSSIQNRVAINCL